MKFYLSGNNNLNLINETSSVKGKVWFIKISICGKNIGLFV